MRGWALLAVAAVLGAGCGSPSAEPGPEPAPTTLGSIAGTVVDEAIRPLAGVVLRLDDAVNAATDANGSFQFLAVAPGQHELVAQLEGFVPGKAAAIVETGETVDVRVILAAVPLPEPFQDVYQFRGLIGCGFAFYTPLQPEQGTICPTRVVPGAPSDFDHSEMRIPMGPLGDVVGFWLRMDWTPTTPALTDLQLNWGYAEDLALGNAHWVARANGTSPLIMRIPVDEYLGDLPENPSPHCSLEACEAYGLVRPAANQTLPASAALAVQQQFTLTYVVFHNGELPTEYGWPEG